MSVPSERPVPYVFLSYASADRERALQIADLLETRDVAVLSSPASMASPNVQQEIQLAWESRRPILPLILEAAHQPEAIRYALAGRQWVEILARAADAWLAESPPAGA